jgi:hypothetical protein
MHDSTTQWTIIAESRGAVQHGPGGVALGQAQPLQGVVQYVPQAAAPHPQQAQLHPHTYSCQQHPRWSMIAAQLIFSLQKNTCQLGSQKGSSNVSEGGPQLVNQRGGGPAPRWCLVAESPGGGRQHAHLGASVRRRRHVTPQQDCHATAAHHLAVDTTRHTIRHTWQCCRSIVLDVCAYRKNLCQHTG